MAPGYKNGTSLDVIGIVSRLYQDSRNPWPTGLKGRMPDGTRRQTTLAIIRLTVPNGKPIISPHPTTLALSGAPLSLVSENVEPRKALAPPVHTQLNQAWSKAARPDKNLSLQKQVSRPGRPSRKECEAEQLGN